jgi:hypothetical protein
MDVIEIRPEHIEWIELATAFWTLLIAPKTMSKHHLLKNPILISDVALCGTRLHQHDEKEKYVS